MTSNEAEKAHSYISRFHRWYFHAVANTLTPIPFFFVSPQGFHVLNLLAEVLELFFVFPLSLDLSLLTDKSLRKKEKKSQLLILLSQGPITHLTQLQLPSPAARDTGRWPCVKRVHTLSTCPKTHPKLYPPRGRAWRPFSSGSQPLLGSESKSSVSKLHVRFSQIFPSICPWKQRRFRCFVGADSHPFLPTYVCYLYIFTIYPLLLCQVLTQTTRTL